MSFSINKKNEAANLVFEIKGQIDEDATFSPQDLAGSTSVIFDLNEVTAINSVGIREWIKWTKSFPNGIAFAVRRCPKIIVDQINMVAGFLPDQTKILSFYVPYFAEESGNEKMVLFEHGKEFDGSELFPPNEVKDDSGEAMEMDVIEAKYFKFLNG